MGYSSDISKEQFIRIESILVQKIDPRGRKKSLDMHQVVNAILYLITNGCKWQDLPKDFPNYKSVYNHYARWIKWGYWEEVMKTLKKSTQV